MSRPYEKANDLNLRSHIRYVPRPRNESKLPRKIGVALVLGVVVVAVGIWWAAKI